MNEMNTNEIVDYKMKQKSQLSSVLYLLPYPFYRFSVRFFYTQSQFVMSPATLFVNALTLFFKELRYRWADNHYNLFCFLRFIYIWRPHWIERRWSFWGYLTYWHPFHMNRSKVVICYFPVCRSAFASTLHFSLGCYSLLADAPWTRHFSLLWHR